MKDPCGSDFILITKCSANWSFDIFIWNLTNASLFCSQFNQSSLCDFVINTFISHLSADFPGILNSQAPIIRENNGL